MSTPMLIRYYVRHDVHRMNNSKYLPTTINTTLDISSLSLHLHHDDATTASVAAKRKVKSFAISTFGLRIVSTFVEASHTKLSCASSPLLAGIVMLAGAVVRPSTTTRSSVFVGDHAVAPSCPGAARPVRVQPPLCSPPAPTATALKENRRRQ